MWGEAAKDTEERGDSKLLPTKNKVETKKEDAIPSIKKIINQVLKLQR